MLDLKRIIEEHPIIILASICVTVASFTTGVVGWFWNQSSLLEKSGFDQQLASVKAELTDQITDLKQRLISIERRVGGNKLYLDVSKLSIAPTEVPALELSYKSFSNGQYYAIPPSFSHWTEQKASQIDFITSVFGENLANKVRDFIGNSGNKLLEKSGMLWLGDESIKVVLPTSSPMQSEGIREFRLKPYVFVMLVNESLIKNTLQILSSNLERLKDKPDPIDKIVNSIIAFNKDNNVSSDISKVDKSTELVEELNSLFTGDLAGFLLIDRLSSNFIFSIQTGGLLKVVAADKKGNVFYLHTHLLIPTEIFVTVRKEIKKVIFDQEFFFIGRGKDGILIQTGVPSMDLRNSNAYAWTQGWLTSLRVPID